MVFGPSYTNREYGAGPGRILWLLSARTFISYMFGRAPLHRNQPSEIFFRRVVLRPSNTRESTARGILMTFAVITFVPLPSLPLNHRRRYPMPDNYFWPRYSKGIFAKYQRLQKWQYLLRTESLNSHKHSKSKSWILRNKVRYIISSVGARLLESDRRLLIKRNDNHTKPIYIYREFWIRIVSTTITKRNKDEDIIYL